MDMVHKRVYTLWVIVLALRDIAPFGRNVYMLGTLCEIAF